MEFPVVRELVIVQAIPEVVDPLPPIEEFPGPVYNLLHQKQFAAGETPETLVEIPVVQEQVVVQAIPEVVDSLPPVQQFTGPGFFHVHHEHIAAVPAVTEFFPLSDDEGDAERGSPPPCLGEPRGPHDRIQQRTVEQLAEVVPMVHILDIPEPQGVDQLVDVLRFVDALVLVAEQVIEVPKIILENIPPRRLVRDPQLAEQLVDVPTRFPVHVLVPRMEDQLVEVPQIVTHIVPRSFFVSTDGYIWSSAPWACGGLLVEVWHHPHPVDPPPPPPPHPHRDTPPGQGGIQILAKGEWTSL